ncbi:MAG: histidine phosphatase family protein [Saprospiraceae bacterium]|nr:histidine phosphatase family protein [Saprospiraceae bacterium]
MQPELRNICLVRHAKSSWADPLLPDISRPLNDRGFRDAPFMAEKMKELGISPDLILTSPANRAKTTAKYFRDAHGLSKKDFWEVDELYGASPWDMISEIQQVPAHYRSVFVFGHNPTMTSLANMFPGVDIDNVPTCGILQAKTMVAEWSSWSPDVSAFVGFYYPKQYFHA